MEQLISEGAKFWIPAGALAAVFLILLAAPLIDRFRGLVGAAAAPAIATHDISPNSHNDIRSAVALLNRSVEDLQRQINSNEQNRKESLEAVQRQLSLAIELLEH